MNVHDSISDLNKLLEDNADFVNRNLNFADKMLDQVPKDQKDDLRSKMTDIRKSMANMDSSKLMKTIQDLNNYGG